jgi:hypothetical protein
MGTVGSNPTPSASYIPTMRTHRIFVCVIALGAVLGMTSTASAGPSSDQEIADNAVLIIDDVPEGFEEQDPNDSSPVCKAVKKASDTLDKSPNAEHEFEIESSESVSGINNKVSILPTVKRARSVLRTYDSKGAGCLEERYREQFEEKTGGEVEVDLSSFEPAAGDEAIGFEGSIDVTVDGDNATFYIDVEMIRVGAGIAAFFFFNTGSPPPSDGVSTMVETVVTRLEASLA